jgi:hypothetical protein
MAYFKSYMIRCICIYNESLIIAYPLGLISGLLLFNIVLLLFLYSVIEDDLVKSISS